MKNPQTALVLDVDSIQHYLFAASRMRDVVGASRILAGFDRWLSEYGATLPGAVIVRAAGGSGEILFSGATAEDLASTLARDAGAQLSQATGGVATLSAGIATDAKLSEGELLAQARRKMETAKRRRSSERVLPHFGLITACGACGAPAATTRAQSEWLCSGCAARRVAYQPTLKNQLPFERARGAATAQRQDIASLVSKDSYAAFVVADVDGLGEQLARLESRRASAEDLAAFSQTIGDALSTALVVAHGEAENHMPNDAGVQTLVQGGDDVFTILDSGAALRFATTLSREFSKATKLTEPPSLSVGMVIAHPKLPIRQAWRCAKSVLAEAKKRRAEQGSDFGYVDYVIVTESVAPAIEAVRHSRELLVPDTQEGLVFTQRPFPVREGAAYSLHEQARTLLLRRDSVARSKLYELREKLSALHAQSLLGQGVAITATGLTAVRLKMDVWYRDWRAQALRRDSARELWCEVESTLGLNYGAEPTVWLNSQAGRWVTPLPDLADSLAVFR